ncbi:MAG: hypothetical protein K2X34_02055 [Hyphomonadaceae bacterium]|nr:hypothetical protein [Hyphomonadaceae bacterium]MBY0565146.1 hypothetical protein [Hyphomonadaceae bacterium]
MLRFEGIGRFLVRDGSEIVFDQDPLASDEDVRTFLYGASLGAIVHQRGMVPLHVSAIAAPCGGVAFTGESEAGKSTTAAFMNQKFGWPLICDDVAVVQEGGDAFTLASGLNTVKLWQSALTKLNRSSENLTRDLTRSNKFHAISAERFCPASPILRHLVRLDWGNTLSLEPVRGRVAYTTILGALYRPEYAAIFDNQKSIAKVALNLATSIQVWTLSRKADIGSIDNVGNLIAARFGQK